MSASDAFGLFGCGLLSLAAVATLIPLRRFPVRVRCTVVLVAALAVFVPIGDLSIAACVRSVTGDLSMTTLVLAGAACIAQLRGRSLIGLRDRQALCWLLALAAVFLYPFALGWTRFDPYALGYGSIEFVTALLLVTFAAWWARLDLIVFVIIAAALAYLAGAYESRNLWDTLIDPLVALYAMARLLAAAALSRSP
jgi:hypothetical protein